MSKNSAKNIRYVSSFTTDTGEIGELVFDAAAEATAFAVANADRSDLVGSFKLPNGQKLVPIAPDNNLVLHRAVLLAERPEPAGDTAQLIQDIQDYIDRYVDLSPSFRIVATHYVLLTWVYDAFKELPYLRFRGEPGSGKTRALMVVGSLCYKAFLATGASTVSPIFHTLDIFRGTLVLDEADFRMSDEKMELVKILNSGNTADFRVFRAVQNQTKDFNPRAFNVYGPKIVAMRHDFADRALESRFLTEEMGQRPHRADIPINLPDSQAEEAQALRNRLLSYRFAELRRTCVQSDRHSAALSSRMNQILIPLLSITEDEGARMAMLGLANAIEERQVSAKRQLPEALVLEVLRDLLATNTESQTIPLAHITKAFQDRFGADFERPITGRYIGSLISKRLHLYSYKSRGVFVLPRTEASKVKTLCEKFGIADREG